MRYALRSMSWSRGLKKKTKLTRSYSFWSLRTRPKYFGLETVERVFCIIKVMHDELHLDLDLVGNRRRYGSGLFRFPFYFVHCPTGMCWTILGVTAVLRSHDRKSAYAYSLASLACLVRLVSLAPSGTQAHWYTPNSNR